MDSDQDKVLSRELKYHEHLYSGFAQSHFAKPAVRALRRHMVRRILDKTGAGKRSRVLSIGCGIGDTELLLARHVDSVIGIDLSPAAIRQANADAIKGRVTNFSARHARLEEFNDGKFDTVIAIFFLHHLTDRMLTDCAAKIASILKPGGVFYGLDPSRYRLSGYIGELLFPQLMAKYQTDDERQLEPAFAAQFFAPHFADTQTSFYDFVSTPLAGLFPSWAFGYKVARLGDELLIRTPVLNKFSSNFEITARARG